jgi:hypothetical protein
MSRVSSALKRLDDRVRMKHNSAKMLGTRLTAQHPGDVYRTSREVG